MDKKVTIKLERLEYVWENGVWFTSYNNLIVNTSLSQKLTALAIKNNLLKLEDVLKKNHDDSDKRST